MLNPLALLDVSNFGADTASATIFIQLLETQDFADLSLEPAKPPSARPTDLAERAVRMLSGQDEDTRERITGIEARYFAVLPKN
jgi:hypothetical protein